VTYRKPYRVSLCDPTLCVAERCVLWTPHGGMCLSGCETIGRRAKDAGARVFLGTGTIRVWNRQQLSARMSSVGRADDGA
jgi:hypothetical protein